MINLFLLSIYIYVIFDKQYRSFPWSLISMKKTLQQCILVNSKTACINDSLLRKYVFLLSLNAINQLSQQQNWNL